jgi:S-sulfo-L-cysteine synthase (O-acetyl-L-serine-dependent)
MRYQNILDTIGNTPMVKINNLIDNDRVEVYAKLEGVNPSGSIKDRIALEMIADAERMGELTKDKIIIEPTSGNTGIALAMIGAVKGYRVHIVMSKAVSVERQKMIKAFGAKIILTAKDKGTDGAILRTHEIVNADPEKYFMPNQFSNENNKLAHYKRTAREIWDQMNGNVDYFVAALGTSGTIMGVGTGLKNFDEKIQIVEAHPVRGHYIQGLKNMKEAIVPEIYDESLIDEKVMIVSEDAFRMTREIIKKEGISVGMSSGAAMIAVKKIAQKIEKGRIAVIFPDRAEKYVSTSLFA